MKYLLLSLLLLLSSLQFARAQQLVMSLEWICSTTNTADFQVRLTNTGSVPLTFNALIVRGVHAPSLTTGTISWQALNDNTIPEWLAWPQFTTNLAYNAITRQLNFSSNVTIFTSVTAPLLAPGSNVIVGSFRMFTSTTWVPNSNFDFVWSPTGAVNCYLPGMTTVTSFQQTGFSSNTICGQCVTVNASIAQPLNLSAPTSPANQSFCSTATISDLIASPLYISPQIASILWYDTPTGGTALNPTSLITSGTYYAAQMVNGCESARTTVAVSVIPLQITASDPLICQGETVSLSIPQSGSSNTICAVLPANLQNGLVGYWPFCGNANDESGNGNNGTVNGATLTTDRFGNANNAYSFNGVDNSIESGLDTLPNNAYTIASWLITSISQPNEIGIVVSRTTWNVSTGLYVFNNSQYLQSTSTCSNFYYNSYSVNPLNDGIWHFYVATFNGFQFKIYLDGILTSTIPSNIQMCIDAPFIFGNDNLVPNRFFSGKLDDIGIWDHALTSAEIQQLYTQGQTTYAWSPGGEITANISVTPTTTTTYTCTATNNGESCTSNYTITVNNNSASTDIVTACDSYIWLDGNTYTTANNTATFTTTNAAGCDSIITLNLTITPSTSNTTPISACGTYTWANNGQTYTASGIYSGTTANCVTEILDLTITPSTTNTTPTSACGTYTWANNGQTYTASGIYLGTITNCITEILNLTITPSSINTTLISSCGSYTWLNNSQTYTTSGIYSGTTANCVTETLNLTITPNSTNTTPISACGTYTWLNNGQTYTASGTYNGTTTNCVTQTIDLTIIPSTTNTTPISACGTYTWANNGQTYTTSGIYSGTTANCISETLNLTITPSTTNTTPISACGTYTWANNGQTYTTSGVFNGTTTNCITQVLNLSITPNSSFTTTINECNTYTWANNGQTYTASGVFNGTVINCVLQVLDLEIIDCISDSDNDGLTDYEESFLCTNPSLFDTDGDGLSDGDEDAQGSDPCDPCNPSINSVNCILGIHIPTAFSPNGSGFSENNVYQIIAGQDIAEIAFKIIDRWGNILFESEDKEFQWDGSYKGQKCNNGVYAYFVDVSYSNGKKEKLSGNITMIR
jgi:gliding motility-associated-like protein